MRIDLKHGVNPFLTTEFAIGLGWVAKKWEELDMGPFVVTSLKDSHHGSRSQHKQNQPFDVPGEAADIRTWHHWDADADRHSLKLIKFARMLQHEGFAVVVHPCWLPGTPHLHFAFKRPIFRRTQ